MEQGFVALLRGINVGGRNRIAMTELKSVFRLAGCQPTGTCLQSGNVLFRSTPAEADRVRTAVGAALTARMGTEIPIVLRSGSQLARTASQNPFLAARVDPRLLHVGFLLDRPADGRVAALDHDRSPPDRFSVRGREIYLCLPNGAARTKLTIRYFEGALGTHATFRNWRTVEALRRLCAL